MSEPRKSKLPRIESDEEGCSKSESESMTTQSVTMQRNSALQGVESAGEVKNASESKGKTVQQPVNNVRAETKVHLKRAHIQHQASSMYTFTNDGIGIVMLVMLYMM